MAYKRVYAPDGEPFDVAENRANELILQKGWTQQPPIVEEVKEEKPTRRRRASKVKEEAPVEEAEEVVEAADEVQTNEGE